MNWKVITGILMFSLMSALYGCGSGDGGKVIFPLYTGQGSTTAVVSFSTISSSTLPARIEGITVTAVLPQGVSVATDPSDPKLISSSALAAGSGLNSQLMAIVQGSYSSAGRLVRITVTAYPGVSPGDEFALLTCMVGPGATLTTAELYLLNNPIIQPFEASGFDEGSGSTVDLTPYLTPQFTVL